MEYRIKINDFEGPLDLLLHLVKESNINIYDININEITKQYLDYIHHWQELNIDIASEYLVMAATLMEIKSKSLLPTEQEKDVEVDEEEVTKEVLIQKLVEYQKYKEITKDFKNLELERRSVYTKAPSNLNEMLDTKVVNDSNVTLDDLMVAFTNYLERKNLEKPIHTKVTSKEYSVKKRKQDIKTYLLKNKKAEFTELFTIYNKSYMIVTFMSILELAKEDDVFLTQEANFDKIFVELKVK
jgi:segregation and condensation protein A